MPIAEPSKKYILYVFPNGNVMCFDEDTGQQFSEFQDNWEFIIEAVRKAREERDTRSNPEG